MGSQPFKVIVVGSGPVGLTAAHALWRAGIDFIVLERRESAIVDAGSNQVLQTVGMRALGQLGLLDALRDVSSALKDFGRLGHDGRDLGNLNLFTYEKENFGAYSRVLSRHDLTKVLYESLPVESQNKVLANKKVSNISNAANGITVSCADGTSYSGSIVVGADGAHSLVRECMRTLALEAGSAQVNEELPFLTTYRCLWVRFPTSASPDLRPGITSETHGYQAATQLFSSEGTTVTGVYERLEKPTRQRIRHTQADQEALVRRWAHLPLTPSKKFTMGDAYRNRVEAGLVSLEEGVVEHWSWGSRVVLAGDAAHKFTPSTGAGCNHGIADVVALANELHKVVQEAHGEAPKAEQIETAFRAYQETRRETTVQVCQRAGNATASATWGSWVLKFVDLYLLPREMMQSRITKGNAALTSRTPVFNYLPGEEPLMGKVPWLNPVPSTGSRQGMVSDIVGMYE